MAPGLKWYFQILFRIHKNGIWINDFGLQSKAWIVSVPAPTTETESDRSPIAALDRYMYVICVGVAPETK